jgi:hypothetical protein
VIDYKQSVNS